MNLITTPAAELNKTMAKKRLAPTYSLVFREVSRGRETFMMLVTCPLTQFGEPSRAYSHYCRSLKEAKHSAALAFIKKFLPNKDHVPYSFPRAIRILKEADRIYYEELEQLADLCSQYDVDPPTYSDVSSGNSQTQTMECHVSDLVTKGTERNAVDARRMATRRMIEMLTKTGLNDESSESPIPAAPVPDHKIVPSSDNMQEYWRDNQKCDPIPSVVHAASAVSLPEACGAGTNCDTAETLFKSLNLLGASKKEASNHDSGTDLKSNVEEDSQRIPSMRSISSRLDRSKLNCVASEVGNSNFSDPSRKLTWLQAISRINRIFRTVEKELHENILNALVHMDLPRKATVEILRQEFVIIIKRDSPPMIFEEHRECSDQSIRVACLDRLFQDLTNRSNKG